MLPQLLSLCTKGAFSESHSDGNLLLQIPAGEKGIYRLAQVDDYHHLARNRFPWQPPIRLSLQARCSVQSAGGTWGFGFWNDPFSANLGFGGMSRRLPVLPNCSWFFYASPENHLAIYDRYPAEGFLAATFSSCLLPSPLLAFALPFSPLMLIPSAARILRKVARVFVQQDAGQVEEDVTAWHSYQIDWQRNSCSFMVDQKLVLQTSHSPAGRLGLVIWVDNQFFAFPSSGKLRWGTLAQPQATQLEIKELQVTQIKETR